MIRSLNKIEAKSMKEHKEDEEQPSSFAEQRCRVGPCCAGRSGSRGRIIWTPHHQHRDSPFALSSCPCRSSSSKSWPLPYRPAQPSPKHQGREPRLQPILGEPSSGLTQLWCPGLATGFPVWNIHVSFCWALP